MINQEYLMYMIKKFYFPVLSLLFSGKINQPGSPSNNTAARKILAKSGSALVHFYSDKHLQDAGFNITYRYANFNLFFGNNEYVLFLSLFAIFMY